MKSIKLRLCLLLIVVSCTTGGGVSLLTYMTVGRLLLSEVDRGLMTQAHALAALVEQHDGRIELEWAREAFPQFEAASNKAFFRLIDAAGKTLAQSISVDANQMFLIPTVADQIVDIDLPGDRAARQITLVFFPHLEDHTVVSTKPNTKVTLVVAANSSDLGHTMDVLATVLAIATAIFAALAGVGSYYLVDRGLRPIAGLSDWTNRVNADSLNSRLDPADWPPELAPIISRLNLLLQRLQDSFEDERRFSVNFSHELRTPVAELRSLSDVANRWPDDPVAQSQLLHGSQEIAVRMMRLIDAILSLSRMQSARQLEMTRCNLTHLVRGVLKRYQPEFDSKNTAVEAQIDDDVVVLTSPSMFEAIVGNLISNAASYAPAGTSCQVCLSRDEQVRFQIRNQANQLTAADLPKLAQPLWRKDEVRTESEHVGLGLFLVEKYTRALSANLQIGLDDQKVLSISIVFPVGVAE